MLDYSVKIGLVAMRRNTTDRPRGTFLTWYSAEQRGKRFTQYIQEHFASDKVTFVVKRNGPWRIQVVKAVELGQQMGIFER